MRKVIITCAVTGGSQAAAEESHFVPRSPQAIASSAIEAIDAGAAIVHVHVRDPDTGAPAHATALYQELYDLVRAARPQAIMNVTCSMLGLIGVDAQKDDVKLTEKTTLASPFKRVEHVLEVKPEIGTIDCGSFSVGSEIFVCRKDEAREMAILMKESAIKPELECFDLSHIETVRGLLSEGVFASAPLVQLCLGVYGAPAELDVLNLMAARVPRGCPWAGFGIGPNEYQIMEEVISLGGHVRVGLEDNRRDWNGELCSNARLVAQAVSTIKKKGCDIASPSEARSILSI